MKRPLRLLGYACIAIVLCAATAYVSYRIMITRMTVEVPDLIGMSLIDAGKALESRGLYIKVAGQDNDLQIPPGHVLSQDIAAGEKIKGLAEINVVVSKGPAVTLIPGVIGEKADEALKLFSQKGLEVARINVHSDTIEREVVIAQWPSPEDWKGQNITLVVSRGPYEVSYYCPSFLGLLRDDALSLAKELGLNVELTEAIEGEAIVGTQKPMPGEKILKGSTLFIQLKGADHD